MSNLRRSASLDRLLAETDFRHKVAADRGKCSMLGYPYCCTGHYYSYRYWPYYLDHRVADHGCSAGWLHHGSCPCGHHVAAHPYPYYPMVDYDLWPRYYSEYLRGYDYGLCKYKCASPSPRVASGCVWCPRRRKPATTAVCRHCCRA